MNGSPLYRARQTCRVINPIRHRRFRAASRAHPLARPAVKCCEPSLPNATAVLRLAPSPPPPRRAAAGGISSHRCRSAPLHRRHCHLMALLPCCLLTAASLPCHASLALPVLLRRLLVAVAAPCPHSPLCSRCAACLIINRLHVAPSFAHVSSPHCSPGCRSPAHHRLPVRSRCLRPRRASCSCAAALSPSTHAAASCGAAQPVSCVSGEALHVVVQH